jgi:hypothetical protein
VQALVGARFKRQKWAATVQVPKQFRVRVKAIKSTNCRSEKMTITRESAQQNQDMNQNRRFPFTKVWIDLITLLQDKVSILEPDLENHQRKMLKNREKLIKILKKSNSCSSGDDEAALHRS